jgi:hypothetical protein
MLQIIGRGARQLSGVDCNVSFDSSSEFAANGYVGGAIMDAMDFVPAGEDRLPDDGDDGDDQWPPEPPADPNILIERIELLNIDSGNEGVQRMARVLEKHGADLDFAAMRKDAAHAHWQTVISDYRTMRKIEADAHDERAIIEQWNDKVKYALTNLTSVVVILMKKNGRQIFDEKRLRGEIKKAINTRKKQMFGGVENDVDVLQKHYGWCVALDRDLRERRSLPSWLSL